MRKPAHNLIACGAVAALLSLSACKTTSAAVDGVKSAGEAVADGVSSVPSLVNVNLSNVLNDLALDLKIDKANVPINAQIPISLAANVCGTSINILSIGGSGKSEGCTAQTASPELVQAVQQQLAANGSVGGGAQTGTTPATGTTPTTTTTPTTATTTATPVTTVPTQPTSTTPTAQ
jgi:hypothetical protein